MATATVDKKQEPKVEPTKTTSYPSLTTLVDDAPPIEGEHVYECCDARGHKHWVKAISPAQAALSIVTVKRVSQKSILYAMSQAILNRKAEGG